MLAAQVTRLDGPRAIEIGEIADPPRDANRVIIDVSFASLSFPDLLLSYGRYQLKPELPFVPGVEVSGIVRSAPVDSGLVPGQRVAAVPGVGGLASVVSAAPAVVFPLPDEVSLRAGAALPMNYLTMHFGLFRRGRVVGGETVLVHGAAGGVGSASLQLLRAVGVRAFAVVSTPAKAELARAAGADETLAPNGFRDAVMDLTGGRGVDVIVDPVGGDRFTESLRCLAPEGRLLVVGFAGGPIPEVRVNRLLLRNIDLVGVGWGPFWHPRPEFLHEQWQELTPLMAGGQLDPPISHEFTLDGVGEALQALENRTLLGKAVVRIS
jgi:NADPH:quinone reductase